MRVFDRFDELARTISELKHAPEELTRLEQHLATFYVEMVQVKESLQRFRHELPELERRIDRNA
jgi:predicted  nucleic acid-binding Zn-ribbon protein